MNRAKLILSLVAVLLAMSCQSAAAASDAYSDAYGEAQTSGKLLVVTVGVDGPLLADPARFVACRLPAGFEWAPGDFVGSKGLASKKRRIDHHPSLSQMDGDGAFIVTFPEGQGRVIAV